MLLPLGPWRLSPLLLLLLPLFLSSTLAFATTTTTDTSPISLSSSTLNMAPQASASASASASATSLSSTPAAAAAWTDPETPLRIGFLGCGTIASAIATGLATQTKLSVTSICVTRRSAAKSAALVAKFPDLVNVYDDPQQVVDDSDLVFCCLLPQQTSQVLQTLTFDSERHLLVSLVSTSTLDGLMADSRLPKDSIAKMICLPAVATLQGISLVTPPQQTLHPVILPMLSALGGFVECDTQHQMNAMMVPTGMMGSMYGLLKTNRDWLVTQGVNPKDASYVVAQQYSSMMQDALEDCTNPERFEELIEEQTPGGLNEQALQNLGNQGVWGAYEKVMDALLDRLEGRSDGALRK